MTAVKLRIPLATAVLLGLSQLPTALAHGGGDEAADILEDHAGHAQTGQHQSVGDAEYPPSYFAHTEYVALLYAHIAIMMLAWVLVLPVAVMLSIARSRHTFLSQAAFTALNGLGVVLASFYNARTPDLYPNNAHHSIGWVATWVPVSQLLISSLSWVAECARNRKIHTSAPEHDVFLPLSPATQQKERNEEHEYGGDYRLSDDGLDSGSRQSQRISSSSTVIDEDEGLPMPISHMSCVDDMDYSREGQQLSRSHGQGVWTTQVVNLVSSNLWRYLSLACRIVDRIILPLGFVALTTGIVTTGRFFEGKNIFNGLAHWIKGGVFFWLGLFTLGRWSGSFSDLGWAWNMRPASGSTRWRPSAEFVESALIFFYGSTNIFLEHLGNWGGKWAPQDLEHLAITVLFIGGGLCGMLIESSRVRELLNVATAESMTAQKYSDEEELEERKEPVTYRFSLNPIPALVILLLGVMMSSHHQNTMISTMIHKQWGNLLVGASFARGLTYLLVYLSPPASVLPSRPPTELLASFGLMAGGIIFMVSSADTVQGMIHYNLDAMFMYTITMGFVSLLMAWEVIVLAIKGAATRQERRVKSSHF